ncbi:PTS sugar transporter subunit IIA [Companilactobacillus metriopterae]|uniref:PTS sugar transporter subunit IIA n=1 Tax=Companilactobacillus metriopterae TaxID=1909267 RepID=UPI001F50F0EA|nr:PTS glucose transporter subunit IIA [Companilactobacillus metriopterae]
MGLFSKKIKDITVTTIAEGKYVPIEKVPDKVFSSKMMGDGFAILPSNGKIYAPVSGTVASVFPTKHAITISEKNGLQILIHLGIDTVELNGVPFNILVQEGEKIKQDQLIAEIDLQKLKDSQKDSTCMMLITNMDDVKELTNLDLADSSAITVGTDMVEAKLK